MFDHVKPVVSLTGATGFLGSHLMNELLSKGYKVIALGRASGGISLTKRILMLLKWFGNINYPGNLETFEIDYQKPLFGLSFQRYSSLCSKTDMIIHCASETSFSERKRDQVFEFNVSNLSGILDFVTASRAQFFYYISTAYVAGINGSVCKEKMSTATKFTNVYEESKSMAEQIINEYCRINSIPLVFIRPTIVYGDSRTGRSLRFNALYHPIRSVQIIRDIYLNDIRNNGGIRSKNQGIYLDKEGNLHLPIRICLPNKGSINLIPVDYFVNTVYRIINDPAPRVIYQLTNPKPALLEEIVCYNEKLMKVKGIEIYYHEPKEKILRNPAEELFDRFIEPYRPYLSDERIFESTNTENVTGDLFPPEFTYEIFKRCIDYAIKVEWGESIFNDKTDIQLLFTDKNA